MSTHYARIAGVQVTSSYGGAGVGRVVNLSTGYSDRQVTLNILEARAIGQALIDAADGVPE